MRLSGQRVFGFAVDFADGDGWLTDFLSFRIDVEHY